MLQKIAKVTLKKKTFKIHPTECLEAFIELRKIHENNNLSNVDMRYTRELKKISDFLISQKLLPDDNIREAI